MHRLSQQHINTNFKRKAVHKLNTNKNSAQTAAVVGNFCLLLLLLTLPTGSKWFLFCGLYLGSYKVTPKNELLWSLWVNPKLKQAEPPKPASPPPTTPGCYCEHQLHRSRPSHFLDPSGASACHKRTVLGFRL